MSRSPSTGGISDNEDITSSAQHTQDAAQLDRRRWWPLAPLSINSQQTARRATTAGTLTATLGLAAASWIVAVHRIDGMDMGVATELGSFPFFVTAWVSMMAAMMLPGAVPAALGRARISKRALAAPPFVGSYLAVWALVGLAVYALYRPHDTAVAGALTIVAGLYELTPLKRHFRRRCRENVRSGVRFGLSCVGSSVGLMVTLLALGVMTAAWMSVVPSSSLGRSSCRREPRSMRRWGSRSSPSGSSWSWRPRRSRVLRTRCESGALRALDVATGGQILIGPRVFAAVEERVETAPAGKLELKGFGRPVPAYEVRGLR